MNSRILSVFSAVALALVATAPLSHAVVYTPSQFNIALKAAVGTKKGAKAFNAAANFYKKALGDKKNKKNADKYAKSIVKIIKSTKVVPIALQGTSVNTQVKALLAGYFKGTKFNINDSVYNKALKTFLGSLQGSQRTAATSQLIYTSIKTYATGKGVSQNAVYAYYTGVSQSFQLPPPPVS